MNEAQLLQIVQESVSLKKRFFEENLSLLLEIGSRMTTSLKSGGRVLAFGNGGSAADAQHLAAELVGRYLRNRQALSSIALTTDPSIVTAVANDMGFEAVFRRQVEAHGRPGDVAFGITTSGRSENVLQAFKAARERGLLTVALTGGGGGTLPGRVDYLIDVPHKDTPRIQEVHAMVVHVLCQIVEEGLEG